MIKEERIPWYYRWWAADKDMWKIEGEDYYSPTEIEAYNSLYKQCQKAERIRYLLNKRFYSEDKY